jgi:hypothetical protein
MECHVVVEKILDVGEQRSIVKTFFVMEGYKKLELLLKFLLYFYCRQFFHKMKIPMVSTKSSILV